MRLFRFLSKGERDERMNRLKDWSRSRLCFAWRPHMLRDGTVVWLEFLEWRFSGYSTTWDGYYKNYEYRRPGED